MSLSIVQPSDTVLSGLLLRLRAQQGTPVVFGNDGTAIAQFSLPTGAIPVALIIDVRTAFDDSGTDLLDVGETLTPDDNKYIDDYDLSSAGMFVVSLLVVTAMTEETQWTATYNGQNSNSAAGAVTLTLLYLYPEL